MSVMTGKTLFASRRFQETSLRWCFAVFRDAEATCCGEARTSVTAAPSVPGGYSMAVPAMSLELHERGIHAVWPGGPGPRPGGTGVTGARQDAPAPQTPKPRKTRNALDPGFHDVLAGLAQPGSGWIWLALTGGRRG